MIKFCIPSEFNQNYMHKLQCTDTFEGDIEDEK